jgi:hypothetical protein
MSRAAADKETWAAEVPCIMRLIVPLQSEHSLTSDGNATCVSHMAGPKVLELKPSARGYSCNTTCNGQMNQDSEKDGNSH